jgi:hypothetical protein
LVIGAEITVVYVLGEYDRSTAVPKGFDTEAASLRDIRPREARESVGERRCRPVLELEPSERQDLSCLAAVGLRRPLASTEKW